VDLGQQADYMAVVERVARMWRRGRSVADIAENLERVEPGQWLPVDVERILADDVGVTLKQRPGRKDRSTEAWEWLRRAYRFHPPPETVEI
jgi:hypothetical protein